MSDGFYRKGKPNARRLTNLQISEVSSVDRGAGHGVKVRLMKREGTTMNDLSVADEVNRVMKTLTDNGVPFDRAASVAHRTEVAYKNNSIRKNDVDPCDAERNEKLAWIDTESKRLHKMGGRSVNQAIDEAMRNWAGQNNSPGQR
jgi:hypothetical protein